MSDLAPVSVLVLILAIAVLISAIGFLSRCFIWSKGGASTSFSIWNLANVPRRYLVDVHNVVALEPRSARMHKVAAGSSLAALILLVLSVTVPSDNHILDFAASIAAIGILVGAYLARSRRKSKHHRNRAPGGQFVRLPFGLAGIGAGIILAYAHEAAIDQNIIAESSSIADVLLIAACGIFSYGVFEAVILAGWGGAMKHAFSGVLNLAFHPRPERFGNGNRSVGLKPLMLDAPRLGVRDVSDFSWNRLLNFDACVQCGRCEVVCPANASGQPLNPKNLIQQLVTATENYNLEPPTKVGSTPLTSDNIQAITPQFVDEETIWSCTTCRACVDVCPMMVEHVDAVIDMRRHFTLQAGGIPLRVAETIENVRMTSNSTGALAERRTDWIADINVPTLNPGESCDVLFWVGDSGFVGRNQTTLRAFLRTLVKADVDVAILGTKEPDCGDLARRLGDEETFQKQHAKVVDALDGVTFRTIVTADPHILNCFNQDYPLLGSNFQVQHHTSFLWEQVENGRIQLSQNKDGRGSISYHDPCYLGRYNGVFDAPRSLLKSMGFDLVEMERSREKSRCCGGGGGAAIADVLGRERIPDIRMNDVKETGANLVAVSCPNCMVMLDGVQTPRPKVVDIAELVAEMQVQ